MTNLQRKKNDRETTDRRDMSDQMKIDNRNKNDAMTANRRERADRLMEEHRLKNDQMTANRRKANDRNPWRTFVLWLLMLAIIASGAYYFLIR